MEKFENLPGKAFISVIGKDKVGIISKVSTTLSECNVNIEDISQTILQGMFSMLMAVDLTKMKLPYEALVEKMNDLGAALEVEITVRREEIFTAMHRI